MRLTTGHDADRQRRRFARSVAALLLLVVFLVGSAAIASVWAFDPPSEEVSLTSEEIAARKDAQNYTDEEQEPSADERSQIEDLAKAEQRFVEDHSPSALYTAASTTEITLPRILRSTDLDALVEQGAFPRMRLADVKEKDDFEEAHFTDGSSELLISWQVWPENIDPSIAIPAGSEVSNIGDGVRLATTKADLLKIQTTEARLFDGEYLVSVVLIDEKPGDLRVVEGLGAEVLERLRSS